VTVTPQADASKKTQATVAIQPGVNVVFLLHGDAGRESSRDVERSGQRHVEYRSHLERKRSCGRKHNAGADLRRWVESLPNGDEHLRAASGLVAPGAIPSPNPVSATAVSAADSTKGASAQITVINHVLVSVQPASITLAPLAAQGFTASVLGPPIKTLSGKSRHRVFVCGCLRDDQCQWNLHCAQRPPIPDAIQSWPSAAIDTSQSGIANVAISRARTSSPCILPACTPAPPKASL